MKYFLSFILFLSFSLIAQEEEQFDQCIYSAEEQESSAAMLACFEKFEIENTSDCINHIQTNYGKTQEEASELCFDMAFKFDFFRYLEDRPGDFYDLFSRHIKDDIGLKSYGCSVPVNKNGLDAYNTLVQVGSSPPSDDGFEIIEEEWFIFKAIIHIAESIEYAEINFGETIYPVTDYRFFTNRYTKDENKLIGYIDTSEDREYIGGTDKSGMGILWVIDTNDNKVTIFMDNLKIDIFGDCKWNDIDIDELENN